MCGLAGFVDLSGRARAETAAVLDRMTDSIAHRGPDGRGVWLDHDGRVGLGHRRLSIIDLSPAGAQPMESAGGRHVIVFNGEIYGYRALRDRLEAEGARFRGESDTEALLAALEAWGTERALASVSGMFAFALYDRRERVLTLARDRLGEKPLYVGADGDCLAFGSELRALREHPRFARLELDLDAVAGFAAKGFVPGDRSIWRGVRKLPPGAWLSIRVDGFRPAGFDAAAAARRYWSFAEVARRGVETRIADPVESLDRIEAALRRAVAERLVADRPVGLLLSSGIDSSLVAAMAQEASSAPVKTFTIAFEDSALDESADAQRIAAWLGTEHRTLVAPAVEASAVAAEIAGIYDEPFADPSQAPTLIVSRLARADVAVALSGDGGDELFGGYARYFRMALVEKLRPFMPRPVRELVGAAPAQWLDAGLGLLRPAVGEDLRGHLTGDALKKLADVLRGRDFLARYDRFTSLWPRSALAEGIKAGAAAEFSAPAAFSPLEKMMYVDTLGYLPDDILVKVDRAAMSAALEVRPPILDHDVVEEAWRAPDELRAFEGKGKTALRRLLARRLPAELVTSRKRGFGIPVDSWIRGPLRAWAGDLLSPERLRRDGLFSAPAVGDRWRQHQAGVQDWGASLWAIAQFNAWLDNWR